MKYLRIIFQIFLFSLLIYGSFMSDVIAQNGKKIADSPDSCELISGKLNLLANTFNKLSAEKNFLIIISGNPPKINSRYNAARISDTVKFLTKIHNISSQRIVFGTVESSDKLAYLKFYVNGELVVEIKTIGKGRLCFGDGETF